MIAAVLVGLAPSMMDLWHLVVAGSLFAAVAFVLGAVAAMCAHLLDRRAKRRRVWDWPSRPVTTYEMQERRKLNAVMETK